VRKENVEEELRQILGQRRKKMSTADRAHSEEARYVHEDVIPHARLESGAVHSLVQGHEVE